MADLSFSDAAPLIAALDDPSPSVRLAALRALVRLPLAREVWLRVSHHLMRLLRPKPPVAMPGSPWDDVAMSPYDEPPVPQGEMWEGIPYSEVIEAAAFVPTKAMRAHLHWLLDVGNDTVRRTTARALVKVRDPAAVPALLAEMTPRHGWPIALFTGRHEVAESLSLLDVSASREPVRQAYRRETSESTRFWLALALARAGETAEIEQVLSDLNQEILRSPAFQSATWADSTAFIEKLYKREPLSGTAREALLRIAQDENSASCVHSIASALSGYWRSETEEMSAAEAYPSSPASDARLQALAAAVVKQVDEHGEEGVDLRSLEPYILPYLPSRIASRLVTILFRKAVRPEPDQLGHGIVRSVDECQTRFEPDIPGLVECYLEVWKDDSVQEELSLTWQVRWQIVWTVSRAAPERIVSGVAPWLAAGDERERALAARLIEETILYPLDAPPPLFGGGSAPPDVVRHTGELLEDGEAREGMVKVHGVEIDRVGEGTITVQGDISAVEPRGTVTGVEIENIGGRLSPPAVAKPRPRKRTVKTHFVPQTHPDDVCDERTPLKTGARYYFYLEISKRRGPSMEMTPIDIERVPAKARLTVAVFGFRDGLKVTRGADIGELEVRENGTVEVTRQPLGESEPQSKHLKLRLFFPVRVPRKNGTFRLRCNIYWKQLLLQSRVIHARATARPRRVAHGEQPLRSLLDYALSRTLDPAHLTRLNEHGLSILLNDNGDGTHSFQFFGMNDGKPLKDDVQLRADKLQGMIGQGRGTLRIASWGDANEWREERKRTDYGYDYKYKDRRRDLPRLKADLTNMAIWGREFYSALKRQLLTENLAEFEKALQRPVDIQIAMKESPAYVLPAALIYDYNRFDTGAGPFSFCDSFERVFQQGGPLEELECFQGDCPVRNERKAICPSGFWGFRHALGMPLSVKKGPDVPPDIAFQQDLRVAVGVASDLKLLATHERKMQTLRAGIRWDHADERDEVFRALKSNPHLVYFYCHGGRLERGAAYLQIGTKEHPGLILPSNWDANSVAWTVPRPLVFLNGCHTTAVEPHKALEDLISPLVADSHAAGVIGTEITIFEELATVFAETFFGNLLGGQPVGQAIRSARLKLLSEGNPLGLVYIPFAVTGLRLTQT